MTELSEHLAKDIMAHLECDKNGNCDSCRLLHTDCDQNIETCAKKLRDALSAAKECPAVSQEKEKPAVSECITITVAEYHFLTKLATLLEIILADKSYSPNAVVTAVRTVVQEMVQQAGEGAAE